MKRIYLMGSLAMALSLSLFSCTDENSDPSGDDFKPMESDGKYVGEAVGNFSKEEWYPGGELGTTDNVASGCYEDETPAVTAQGLLDDFNAGEKFFERQFTSANSGFKGLGPASVRRSAFRTNPNPYDTGNKAVAVRVESTIGVMGTGLLDAITEDDLKAQYASTFNYYKNVAKVANVSEYVNPNFWDASADNFASGAWYPGTENTGVYADGGNGKPMVKRFTYALTRATLQDGPGANAIWNITNVTRPDRPKLYTTNAWAAAMAEDKEVIEKIKNDPTSPFWASTDDEISKRVNGLLKPGTNQFSNEWHNFEPEMSADHFYEFMVWHRGLAIPRARNLNDARVQQGKKVFMEIGCANCHRPSWKTGSDNYWTPNMIAGKKLPRYANQTIYPYSDMMQHKLYMVNDIHGSWCRTTPLWGRGLAATNGSGVERLHDCRARNEVEAIMWHAYSKNSHAYNSALKFYNLSKADRDAVVMFLRSI